MPLWRHMADSVSTACALWDGWLPQSVRNLLVRELGDNAREISGFLVGIHDLGKLSDEFASQSPQLREHMESGGLPKSELVSSAQRRNCPHSGISSNSLCRWLQERGVKRISARAFVSSAHGHHGVYGPWVRTFINQEKWVPHHDRAIEFVLHECKLSEHDVVQAAQLMLSQPAQLVLTGLTVMCDWVASNENLFPYSGFDSNERVSVALTELGLPSQWAPQPSDSVDDYFTKMFRLPANAKVRPVQHEAVEIAAAAPHPPLLLIEAATGEGKTEAALAAAEVLAHKFGCEGIHIALPTRATSDAMLSRTLAWAARSIHDSENLSASLLHGKAGLNAEYSTLFREGFRPEQIFDEQDSARTSQGPGTGAIVANSWLAGAKTSCLASVVVSTIDHVLFLALASKHVMLRYLGIAGKVVVLDEIHAADTYMQVYLDRALVWLGSLGVPVIALSATLPPHRRKQMLASYEEGRALQRSFLGQSPREISLDAVGENGAYPLISTVFEEEPKVCAPTASGRLIEHQISFIGDDVSDVVEQVVAAVNAGACVAVIRNTVTRAQEVHSHLSEVLQPDQLELLHSRFLACDRVAKEKKLLSQLGPQRQGVKRPQGFVVVATQVLEQSLDIDADILFSDIAPVDLVIQRAGRVHRHERPDTSRPQGYRRSQIRLTAVTEPGEDRAPQFDAGSTAVYGASYLYRSYLVLKQLCEHSDSMLRSPLDVPLLVRRAYDEELEYPLSWAVEWKEAEQTRREESITRQQAAKEYLVKKPKKSPLVGWNDVNVGNSTEGGSSPGAMAQVRDCESSLDVVAVWQEHGQVKSLPWLENYPDQPVDMSAGVANRVARAVAECSLSLPSWILQGGRDDLLIQELEREGIPGWEHSHLLKGQLPLILDQDLTKEIAGIRFEYDPDLGLLISYQKGHDD